MALESKYFTIFVEFLSVKMKKILGKSILDDTMQAELAQLSDRTTSLSLTNLLAASKYQTEPLKKRKLVKKHSK